MNITVKVNDSITIECECFVEGGQWAVGAGEFGRMPYGFGATIALAVADYISKINNELPPKPVTFQPIGAAHTAIIPPRQTIQSARPLNSVDNSSLQD